MKDIIQKDENNVKLNPETLIMKAIENNSAIDVMERLLDMRERINKEQAGRDFREAMAEFQAECPVIVKSTPVYNKDKRTVRFKYAPLDVIVSTVQPLLRDAGLSYDIDTEQHDKGITVSVTVVHIGGHSKDTKFSVPVDKDAYMNEPQKWASAQTFAKRYAFCNAFGILTGDSDDDGQSSGENEVEKKKKMTDEALSRISGLSDSAKDGLRLLGYNAITADIFCSKFEYNESKIISETNKILDAKGVK